MQQLKIALHSYCLFSRDKSLILAQIRVHEYSRTPHFSTLDPRLSILASQNLNVSTFATQESSFENRVETVNLPLSCTVQFGNVCHNKELYLNQLKCWFKFSLINQFSNCHNSNVSGNITLLFFEY